jgi:hypothetical protein
MAGSRKGLNAPKKDSQARAKKAANMLAKDPVIGKTAVGNVRAARDRTANAMKKMGL